MQHSPHTVRIAISSLIALVMVAGSYALSGPIPFFGDIRVANAQSSAELLREYAGKDSDEDGLLDWQEALYDTDPYDAESFKDGVKDGDAVAQGLIQPKVTVAPAPEPTDIATVPGTAAAPDSVTDRFAQTLFKQYMLSRGEVRPTNEEIASFVEAGVSDLTESSASPAAFSISDVRIANVTGPAALITYASAAQDAFAANTVVSKISSDSLLTHFSAAINGDKTAFKNMQQLGKAYKDIANALMKISVPREAAVGHLAIANALMHMSEVSADMGAINEDPLRALMGIGLYDPYSKDLTAGFVQLSGSFRALEVSLAPGDPGYEIYNTAELARLVTEASEK